MFRRAAADIVGQAKKKDGVTAGRRRRRRWRHARAFYRDEAVPMRHAESAATRRDGRLCQSCLQTYRKLIQSRFAYKGPQCG